MINSGNVLKSKRLSCLAHGLHNLIVVDTIPNCVEIKTVLNKCKSIFNRIKHNKQLLRDQ